MQEVHKEAMTTHRGDEHRVNAPKKVYMCTSTSSGNDKYGAREKLTKRRT